MTNKTRLKQLEKAARAHAPAMTWKRFIQCRPEDQTPEFQREWAEFIERQNRGMDTLADALTEITGQPVTVDQAKAGLRSLN